MNLSDLLAKGYFPKELPPCFISTEYASNFNQIEADIIANQHTALNAIVRAALTTDDRVKVKQIFQNRLRFSDSVQFTIPKIGLSRNTIKIPNPLHQGKLSQIITLNYTSIAAIYNNSNLSTTKLEIETESGEGKRAIRHNSYGTFKERSIIESFNYQIQLKTDISKFYHSIYTHSIPWVTFGGKDKYKKNRDLSSSDSNKIKVIYGDEIDNALMWCQNQQTMGIPIGPDTSLIVAELVGSHIDKLIEQRLKKKKIDWIGFRYYDDFIMFFHSDLDAQIALDQLRTILSDFELKINDEKTIISISSNELEKDWAIALKSFFFRPSLSDQREDIWNFFSLAFKYAKEYPKESILKLALNKFTFVRVEKENWNFFESLLFRIGLTEPSSLAKIAKILTSYKSIVNKDKLKSFCFEIINRNFRQRNDYELTWALWILKDFEIQPTKLIYTCIFKSKSVCASIIALDLINQNTLIKTFDYTDVEELITIENLNKQYWLLVYECIVKDWLYFMPGDILDGHFYFKILKDRNVSFYDGTRRLEPLIVEKSYFNKIERKILQIETYIKKNKFNNQIVISQIKSIIKNLDIRSSTNNREEIQNHLVETEVSIKNIVSELNKIREEQLEFENKKVYFSLGKRLEELSILTSKEVNHQTKEIKDLLFDPDYE